MPKKLEAKLEREASEKGYTGRRKDRYVYGTLNKMGLLNSNHAGNLGPDKLLKGGYEPMTPHVNAVEIGVVVALVLLVWFLFFKQPITIINSTPIPHLDNTFLPSEPYTPIDYSAWEDVQYNSLGANAGDGQGQSN